MNLIPTSMYLWKFTLLLLFFFVFYAAVAQVQVNVNILNGRATSTCGDLVGAPDHVWSVNINNQGWVDYFADSNCPNFFTTPNLQYITTFGCSVDFVSTIEICFRAYENDPGIFTPCDYAPDDCMEAVCALFALPNVGSALTYTLSLPESGATSGQVEFQIQTIGQFPGGQNDVTCSAIDLGILPSGGKLGDASIGTYNNYCATRALGEANPSDSQAPWENDAGVWFTFTTSDQPSQEIILTAKSDPELTGDDIFLQLGLYDAPTENCSGNLRYLKGSGVSTNDFQQDEQIAFKCDRRLRPRTKYYILVDGFTRAPEDIYGIFGLEIADVPFIPTIIKDTICAGANYSLFDNNYSLSGTYLDTLQQPTGCDSIIQLHLTVLEPVTLQINQTRLASAKNNPDGSLEILIRGGSGNYGVFWSDGGIGAIRNDLLGGAIYTLQVMDEYGCSTTTTVTIEYSNVIIASATNDTLDCYGDKNGRIVLRAVNGTPPYHFLWKNLENSEFQGEGTIRDTLGFAGINALPAGNYEIIFVDSINGDVQIMAAVVAPAPITFEILAQRNASCLGSCDAELQLEIQGGTRPYIFDFNASNFDTATQRLSNLCAGEFVSIVSDANFCSALFSTVISAPEPILSFPPEIEPVSCFGGNDGRIHIPINGSDVEFVWNNGERGNSLENLIAGDYVVMVTNSQQCRDSLMITVNEPLLPLSVAIVVDQPVRCYGSEDGKLTAKIEGEYTALTYQWNTSDQDAQTENLQAGTYYLKVVNEKGCSAKDTIVLEQPADLIFDIYSRNLSCAGDTLLGAISVEALNGGTPPYLFSLDGIRFSPNNKFENLDQGIYTLVIQDGNKCEWTEDIELLGTSSLVLDLGVDTTIQLGDTIVLAAITNSTSAIINWKDEHLETCNNCTVWTRKPTRTQLYQAIAVDSLTQCTAMDWVEISVQANNLIYVPNAFSPNQDNINDELIIIPGNAIKQIHRFSIFDRFGNLVYQFADVPPDSLDLYGWNGTFNNSPLPSTVYVYVLEAELINNQLMRWEGDIFLIK